MVAVFICSGGFQWTSSFREKLFSALQGFQSSALPLAAVRTFSLFSSFLYLLDAGSESNRFLSNYVRIRPLEYNNSTEIYTEIFYRSPFPFPTFAIKLDYEMSSAFLFSFSWLEKLSSRIFLQRGNDGKRSSSYVRAYSGVGFPTFLWKERKKTFGNGRSNLDNLWRKEKGLYVRTQAANKRKRKKCNEEPPRISCHQAPGGATLPSSPISHSFSTKSSFAVFPLRWSWEMSLVERERGSKEGGRGGETINSSGNEICRSPLSLVSSFEHHSRWQ